MPKVVDHDEHRAGLLASAFELFSERGYAATSMRELARALEVSTGSLYHYFESKEDIFEQMVRWIAERDILDVGAEVPDDADAETRRAVVFAWVRAHQTYLQRMLLLVFDFQRHRSDDEARALVQTAAAAYRQTFSRLVGQGDAAWSLILGMLIQGILEGQDSDPEAHLRALALLTRDRQELELLGLATVDQR